MSNLKTIDLPAQDRQLVLQILERHIPGRPVYVFGSRVTGRARRVSDLDLAVGGPALTLREHALLEYDFEESMLPMAVDVVSVDKTRGVFRRRIESEWVPLLGNAPEPVSEAA